MVIRHLNKTVLFVVGTLVVSWSCFAQQEDGGAGAAPDLKTKAAEVAGRIPQILDPILTATNEQRTPSQQDLSNGKKFIDESKRYLTPMEEKQKAQYYLLQAWLAYYSNDINAASVNAVRACKSDSTSGDAWATQIAMSILADKKPALPKTPKPQRQRSNPNNPNNPNANGAFGAANETSQPQAVQPGRLTLDMSAIQVDAIGKKIDPLELKCLNGANFSYAPGEESLCVLVWQKFDSQKASIEPNVPGKAPQRAEQPAPPQGFPPATGAFGSGFNAGSATAEVSSPVAAFTSLYRKGISSGKVKYAAFNVDEASHKQEVILDTIQTPSPWVQVMVSAQAGSTPIAVKPVSSSKPVVLLADRAGTIRYVGPAAGFITPMVLRKVISSDAATGSITMTELVDVSTSVADSNSIVPAVADSNSLPKAKPAAASQTPVSPVEPATQKVQYKELSEEEKLQADKKLLAVESLFLKMGQTRVGTYTNAVKTCREVMKEYAGTEYEEKARQLLRRVPEDQRKRYAITDQELGL